MYLCVCVFLMASKRQASCCGGEVGAYVNTGGTAMPGLSEAHDVHCGRCRVAAKDLRGSREDTLYDGRNELEVDDGA